MFYDSTSLWTIMQHVCIANCNCIIYLWNCKSISSDHTFGSLVSTSLLSTTGYTSFSPPLWLLVDGKQLSTLSEFLNAPLVKWVMAIWLHFMQSIYWLLLLIPILCILLTFPFPCVLPVRACLLTVVFPPNTKVKQHDIVLSSMVSLFIQSWKQNNC